MKLTKNEIKLVVAIVSVLAASYVAADSVTGNVTNGVKVDEAQLDQDGGSNNTQCLTDIISAGSVSGRIDTTVTMKTLIMKSRNGNNNRQGLTCINSGK